ncbi:hypothetical protein BCR44DRAFT_1214312 [Catenaria anguillulae PL171]|uniref:Uncharacterized protein n=1 Tax=Catenaria anguillulae PL171 TaxID=765915 RepID=A0A1Y2I152_9FUNG|nr:hypothetical protein BCR44DRAFT_1214312 [Catenaria anguillulae PL171]
MCVADIALCIIVIATERYRTFLDAVGLPEDQDSVLDSPVLHRGPAISPTELRPLTFVVSYLRQFYNRVVDQLQYVTSQSITLTFLDDGYFGEEPIAPAQRIVFMEAIGLVDYAMTCENRERVIYVLQTALFLFEALLVHADHTGTVAAAGAALGIGSGGEVTDAEVTQGLSEEDMITVTLYTTQLSNRLTRLMSSNQPM